MFVVNSLSLVKSTYLKEVYFKFLLSHFPAGAYTCRHVCFYYLAFRKLEALCFGG